MRSPTFSGTFGLTAEATAWGRAITAWGELDMAAVPEVHAQVEAALASGARRLLLDLGAVTFVDSLSLAAIVAAKRRMGPGGRVVIATRHPYVLLIIEAGGLNAVVEVFESRQAAEVSLEESPPDAVP